MMRRVPSTPLLGVLVTVITGLDVWWRTLETRPPHWDMANHLGNSLVYLNGFSLTHPLPFLEADFYYPPFVYWVTDGFYAVLGDQAMWVAILSNVVWIGILVFATFGVGKILWNARVGWLSVAFVVCAPMMVSTSKEYMLDMPLTAIAALSLYLLIRADGFASRRYSLLLGVTCGCGLLVKWTLPLVLVLPVVHTSAVALSEARVSHRFTRLLNLAGAGAVTLAIAGFWYIHNASRIVSSLTYYGGAPSGPHPMPHVASVASGLWYLWTLLNVQLYLIPFLFVLAGIAFCFRKRGFASRNLLPILMVAGTYVTFSLLHNKDPRFTLPMLPALAIIATSWLEYISTRARRWIAAALVVYGAVAFLAISFGTSLLPESVIVDVPATSFGPAALTLFGQYGYIIGPPTSENWHQVDAFKTMAAFPRADRRFAYEGPQTIWFNLHGINYYALRYDADWVKVANARFLLDRGTAHPPPPGFVRLNRWRLPDGGTLAFYERA